MSLKDRLHINQFEEEIALILLGIGGLAALIVGHTEIATFCFGAIAGYLVHGYHTVKKKGK